MDAANSPFLPEAARNIEASLDIAETSIFAIASKQKSPIPSRKSGAFSEKCDFRNKQVNICVHKILGELTPANFRDLRGNPNARRNKAMMCMRRIIFAA